MGARAETPSERQHHFAGLAGIQFQPVNINSGAKSELIFFRTTKQLCDNTNRRRNSVARFRKHATLNRL